MLRRSMLLTVAFAAGLNALSPAVQSRHSRARMPGGDLAAEASALDATKHKMPLPADAWKPNPGPQTEVLSRSENEILYGGARGGGKTDAGLAFMVQPEYIRNPKYRGLVVRIQSKDLSDWFDRAEQMYACLGAKCKRNPMTITFPSGAKIRCGHLKDVNSYKQYQGHEYQLINFEEVGQCPSEKAYLMLMSSSRSTIPGLDPQIFLSANPGGPGHSWLVKRFVEPACKKALLYKHTIKNPETGKDMVVTRSRIFIPASVDDNPHIYKNNPDYIAYLEGLPEELRRAWREGDWSVQAGQYFKKLNRDVHVVPYRKPADSWLKFRSLDPGFNHAAVCLWWAVDHAGNAYIYRGLKEHGLTVRPLARRILHDTPDDEDIEVTVAGHDLWGHVKESETPTERRLVDLMEEEGLYGVEKAVTDRVLGAHNLLSMLEWSRVDAGDRQLLNPPKLFVMDNVKWVFEDLTHVAHDEKKPDDVQKTQNDFDDTYDCVRYGGMYVYTGAAPERELTEAEKDVERIESADKNDAWGGDMLDMDVEPDYDQGSGGWGSML